MSSTLKRMDNDSLTSAEAYLAMYAFLSKQYDLGCEELGAILGSMSLLSDGESADPALDRDLIDAVSAAKAGRVNARLQLGEGSAT